MVVARRRTPATSGTAQDINPATKIIVPEGTKGIVTEQQEGRTVQFEAEIGQEEINEEEVEFNDFESEDSFDSQDYPAYQEPPKDPLTLMFDALRESQVTNGETFIAHVFRRQDFMNDNFNVPCSVDSQFPPLQFTARDIFTFVHTLQKSNNNSGGRFTIRVYRQDGTPVKTYIGRNGARAPVDLGIAMLAVPNPTKESLHSDSHQNNNNQNNGIAEVMKLMIESQNQTRLDMMKMQLQFAEAQAANANQRHEPSDIEKQVMGAALHKLMNPEAPKANTLEETMATMFMMPQMVEGLSRKMFPEPTEPRDPTVMDTVKEVMAMPVVDNILAGVLNIAENAANARFIQAQKDAQTAANPGPPNTYDPNAGYDEAPYQPHIIQEAQIPTENDTQMQDLIEDIIDELQSDTPLNADNETIKELVAEYPAQFDTLKSTCKIATFDQVLALLLDRTKTIQPNPFNPFINMEETVKMNAIIWTAEGNKLQDRLLEFYTYVKTA